MADRLGFGRFTQWVSFSQSDPSRRYLALSLWIIAIIIIYPYFVGGEFGRVVLSLLFSIILIFATLTIVGKKRVSVLAILLLIPSLIMQWLYYIYNSQELLILSYTFSLLALTLITLSILLEVVRAKTPIPKHVIWGAIAVYLLLGLTWATLFNLMEMITPGSFMYVLNPDTILNTSDFFYYSFVTLATLGYGDIVPMTAQARSVAILEAVTGALYLAILISKLVSMSLASHEHDKSS